MGKKLMPLLIGLLFFPFLIVPALMDERYWFLSGSAGMNFSASNLLSYGASFHQPGRFMPLSGYLRAFHSFLGFETMTSFGIPLNIFEGIVHACFITATFVSLYWYLLNVPFRYLGSTKFLEKKTASQITILTAFIFGGMASVRWQHNGLIAYVPMTYLPLISALLLSTTAVKLLRRHKSESSSRVYIQLLIFAVLVSLWANLFYELAYICIVLIVISCIQEFFESKNVRQKRISLSHGLVYAFTFLIYWIPLRMHLAQECASSNCYEGSKLALSSSLKTFALNLINPLPLIGPVLDFNQNQFISELSRFAILIVALISIAACQVVFFQFKAMESSEPEHLDAVGMKFNVFLSLVVGPISIGIASALLMSVSVRAQRFVGLGDPYRHTPILWLAYSLTFALMVYLAIRSNSKIKFFAMLGIVIAVVVVQQLSSFNNSIILQKSHTNVLKIYDEVIFPDFSIQGNERRCSLQNNMIEKNDVRNYLDPSAQYFAEVLKHPYCQQ